VKTQELTIGAFEPETINVMLGVLDEVSDALKADEAARSRLARRILVAVSQGERDPARLREYALKHLVN
jgi:hypothetical protein